MAYVDIQFYILFLLRIVIQYVADIIVFDVAKVFRHKSRGRPCKIDTALETRLKSILNTVGVPLQYRSWFHRNVRFLFILEIPEVCLSCSLFRFVIRKYVSKLLLVESHWI